MLNLAVLKAQPAAPRIADAAIIDTQYRSWRIRSMVGMFVGYAVYYFCRKNLSAATPGMIQDLGYSKTQIGTIWSVLYLTYGLSKMVNGVFGDRANARYFMAIGLFLSAITNWFFGMSSSLMVLGIFWALNGWFQGMGWPPCARLLTQWYSPGERGTWWSIWNTAHQVGGGLILLLGGYLTEHYGWRSAFFVPAIIGVAASFFIVERLRDTPESLGLPPIEEYRNDHPPAGTVGADASMKEMLFQHVLKSREIWLLGIANFFVYLVRYGAMDWAPTFLVEVKQSSIANASYKAAMFELTGIAGAMLAGYASDRWFKGRRSWINVLYMVLLVFAVIEFWWVPPGNPMLDAAALGAVGFLVYGPQMMVGLCAADVVGKHAAGTASGFTGLLGYLGSIVSGVGTGLIVDHYGWNGGFAFFVICAAIGALCFALIRNGARADARNPS
jgi:OPA family sugar phosphate sensor protein UhpC-like MFS transporter